MTEQLPGRTCKRCGSDIGMLSDARRVEMHNEILFEVKRYLRNTRGHRVLPPEARYGLVDAHAYAAFLVCSDKGFCSTCASDMPEFEP